MMTHQEIVKELEVIKRDADAMADCAASLYSKAAILIARLQPDEETDVPDEQPLCPPPPSTE